MRRHRCVLGWLVLICLVVALPSAPAAAQGLNVRMQKVLAQFVETTGFSVMGVGSWISGKGFNPGSSDFDMRLVVPGGGTEAQQLARWRQARTQMISLIGEEFGDDAGKVLGRTNLYAPNQLMHGVENTADAVERFQRLKTVPNLGYTGPVTSSTPGKYVEGLYGSGSQTYVQGYEKAAGRLFYNNNGTCVTGLSELAHMGEGAPMYTAAGTANTAGQWAQHGLTELASGRGDKVAKLLERMERDLVKSRSLSRLPADDAFRNQLKQMRELLKKSPGKLTDVSDDVARLLLRGKAEAAILAGFEDAGPIRRAYMRVMLDGVAVKNKVGELINKIAKATPDWVTTERAMNFVVFAIGTHATAQAAGGGDVMETMRTCCEHMKWITSWAEFGPLFMAEITASILQEAKATGNDLAASSQEAWNLMLGFYTAEGRVSVDPDPRRKLTLADMVNRFQYERKLEAVVMSQCIRASTRDLGSATGKADMDVANAMFARCWPTIRDAWRWERDGLTSEYLLLRSQIIHTPLVIYYKPTQPKPKESIVCEAISADSKLGERLERMRQIIRILYGKGSGLGVNYYWDPGGVSVGDRGWQRGFTFDDPGVYPVKVRLEVAPYTNYTQTEHRVMLRREVPALVDVIVEEPTVDKPPAKACWVLTKREVGALKYQGTGPAIPVPSYELETAGPTAMVLKLALLCYPTRASQTLAPYLRATIRWEWSPFPDRLYPGDAPDLWLTAQYTHEFGDRPEQEPRAYREVEIRQTNPSTMRTLVALAEVSPKIPKTRSEVKQQNAQYTVPEGWDGGHLVYRVGDVRAMSYGVGAVWYTYTWDPTGNSVQPMKAR